MKKIVIMGASSGIGYALAETFASRGVTVGLASRHTKSLHELKMKYPDAVHHMEIDVTRAGASKRLFDLIDKIGGMDIYIHCAGIGYDNPTLDPRREAEIINTNATGFARMISTAYNYFKAARRPGQIAAITSVAGTKGTASLAAYSASKAFDQQYLLALRQLAFTEGVNVSFTDLRPGWTQTPLLKEGLRYPLKMQMEEVVPQILRALLKKSPVAIIDWRWSILVNLWRLIPNALWTRLDIPLTYCAKPEEEPESPVAAESETSADSDSNK